VRAASPRPEWLFTYQAQVERVVDGDTLLVHVNLGFRTWIKQKVRLRGIDCAEAKTVAGKKAASFVRKIVKSAPFVIVKTYKDDKYGRMLADMFYGAEDRHHKTSRETPSAARGKRGITIKKDFLDPSVVAERGMFLNQQLLDKGLAEVWKG